MPDIESSFKEANLYFDEMMVLNFILPDGKLVDSRFISVDLVFDLIKEYFKQEGEILRPGHLRYSYTQDL